MLQGQISNIPKSHLVLLGASLQQSTLPANTHTSIANIIRYKGSALTAEELAAALSLSRKHIYKLAKKNRIPCLRLGGAIRFCPEATAKWLEDRELAA